VCEDEDKDEVEVVTAAEEGERDIYRSHRFDFELKMDSVVPIYNVLIIPRLKSSQTKMYQR
jgi:hypothetical protein